MMSFARPWLLLLLVIPVGLMLWEWRRRGHPLVLPFDHGRQRRGGFLKRLVDGANLLPHALLATAILILARPQRTALPKDERNLTNILFCLDVSGSMISRFGDGKRSDKAIEAIKEFTSYRPGDAFGLTIFGNEVLHWVPVTKDLSALRQSTPFLRPERMPQYLWGTQIGKALREVRKVLTAEPEGDRMVILVSDGQSFDLYGGQAEEIGHQLNADGIVVYYIHVAEGQPQEETFTVASLTGGQAFAAGDPVALKEVFKRIDQMQTAKMKPAAPQAVDDYRLFALAGLALGGLHLLSLFGLRYTPW
jgi:Ca-activated chloride channel family protein